jgi:hypothetical protein
MALGTLIIQTKYGYSDEETALQIQGTAYLQFFCGYREYDDSKLPFDSSTMVYFRKRLTPEIFGGINELIIKKASEPERSSVKEEVKHDRTDTEENDDKHDVPKPPANSGTLIVDAICALSNIVYPQDTALLNDGREKLEKIIDELYDPEDGVKPRTYRRQAHKDYLKTACKRRKSVKDIRRAVGEQLHYIKWDFGYIDHMLKQGKTLLPKQENQL